MAFVEGAGRDQGPLKAAEHCTMLAGAVSEVSMSDEYPTNGLTYCIWRHLRMMWERSTWRSVSVRLLHGRRLAVGSLVIRSRSHTWRRGRLAIRRTRSSTAAALLSLKSRRPGFHECALDGLSDFRSKDWTLVQRSGDRFLPCAQHLIHLAAYLAVDCGIRFHERLV